MVTPAPGGAAPESSRLAMTWLTLASLGGGMLLLAYLLHRYRWTEVVAAFAAAGWGVVGVAAYRVVNLGFDAAGWRALYPTGAQPPFVRTWVVRWIGEGVNSLLPVAQVGGTVLRARLLGRMQSDYVSASASTVVDFTAGVFAQAVFTLLGAGFLFRVAGGRASLVNNGLLALVFFMVLGMLALLIAQRSRFLSRTVRALQRVMPGSVGSLIGRAEALDAALHALHARRGTLARCVMWRLGATLLYTVETWLAMRALGLSVTWQEALILESLGRAVRSAAFFVPGGLGVQEGGLVLLGNVLGLPAPVLLALSFVKRAREILVGVPALAAWGIVERSSSPAAT